jgi:hypothetical protein
LWLKNRQARFSERKAARERIPAGSEGIGIPLLDVKVKEFSGIIYG